MSDERFYEPTPSNSTRRMVSVPPKRFCALLRPGYGAASIQDFQPGEPAFAVIISGVPFGQVLGRHRRFAECDAQCVHFRVVADFYSLDTMTFAQ
jgi:hypothetical protein